MPFGILSNGLYFCLYLLFMMMFFIEVNKLAVFSCINKVIHI